MTTGTKHNRPSAMSTHGDQPVMRYLASKRNSPAMSAITRCQRTIGSAAAPANPTAPPRRARRRRARSASARRLAMARLWPLADRLRQRRGHPFDLALGHGREERQRDRPGGDVLADRELALTVAEALAVEAHEVDGRQVGLALHAAQAQRVDGLVTVAPTRDLDDEHEPAAAVARRVLARQPQSLDAGQGLAVPAGHPRAIGQHAVQARQLGVAEGAREVGQAIVEAQAIVIEPAHVWRAALVALGVD